MLLPRSLPRELLYTCFRPPVSACRSFQSSSRRGEELQKPFYVTTPIYYVNAAPHIGHLYSSVIADVVARWSRLRNPELPVIFATGTDEFGQKVQLAAAAKEVEPQPFCDEVSQTFRNLADSANVSYTRFIRTTEQAHQDAVQHVWRELVKRKHIYKGSHSGWYCIADECFYTDTQVETVNGITVSKESGRPVEWTEEENYMFRLCAFEKPLLEWVKSNPQAILPSKRYKEVMTFLEDLPNFRDLSISRPRSRLQWGVQVPDDPDHTVYVWLDALVNYLTVVGYPWDGEASTGRTQGWPADVQVVGKDIVKFHAIYWPAFLMALGLDPPKQILAHAHWTMDRKKMSKSTGNVVDPNAAMSKYGADVVRMYLCSVGGNLADDSDWSNERLQNFYDGILRNNLGNLLRRVLSPAIMDRVRKVPFLYRDGEVHDEDKQFHETLQQLPLIVQEHMEKREFGHAANAIQYGLTEANGFFTSRQPWATTKPAAEVARAQFYGYESLRIVGILLQPFMPTKASQLLDSLKATRRDFEAAKVGAEGEGAQLRPEEADFMFHAVSDPVKKTSSRPPRKALPVREIPPDPRGKELPPHLRSSVSTASLSKEKHGASPLSAKRQSLNIKQSTTDEGAPKRHKANSARSR
ncbi:hypothetical protein CALVIDRAFT_520038 [Calocera viscosa TUFC12733]|uniref:Probable methionine--tRNA ligase, mitochondrial n=1 Tax=Calocera viscosa (strain TUFC12733) TaxID=1330018 RepID=A0A167ID59_CALVF|nr:hypothetical protein CALVIDRAFT_520038 [Calocera viscosa TUFC12733]